MENSEMKYKSLRGYIGSIPYMLSYQIVSKLLLSVFAKLTGFLINGLLKLMHVEAVSNMDLVLLLKTWQGILIICLLGLLMIGYTIVDISGMVILSDSILHQRNKKILVILKEAVCSIRYMMSPYGLILLFYIGLLAPLTMAFYGVSLTSQFHIPDFILSVIMEKPLFYIPYFAVIIILAIFGFLNACIFHNMILRKMMIKEAGISSVKMMKKHWWNCIRRNIIFAFRCLLVAAASVIVTLVLPMIIAFIMEEGSFAQKVMLSFLYMQGVLWMPLFRCLFNTFQMLEITRIFESYTDEDEGEHLVPVPSKHIPFWICTAGVYLCLFGVSYVLALNFEELFRPAQQHEIIAHRAGGTLGCENTLDGLAGAISEQVYASEIDVQRTADGQYVVFHDNTLYRLCGVDAEVNEMTYGVIRDLEVKNTFVMDGDGAPIASVEEMLDGCRDQIHLYLELKGKTADNQMAEDMYQLVSKYDMLDQVTIICLNYEPLKKLKENHPDVKTGYLCYVALGDLSGLNVDELLLEDELATASRIDSIHDAGKKVFVWTVNSEQVLLNRLIDNSDGVITDQVALAKLTLEMIENDSNFKAVLDRLFRAVAMI